MHRRVSEAEKHIAEARKRDIMKRLAAVTHESSSGEFRLRGAALYA
jgi:hypothetical protein